MQDIIVVERHHDEDVGFIKAYITMLPETDFFPTEILGKDLKEAKAILREENEGTKIGWLDLVMLKAEIQRKGITTLGISHLEMLGKLKKQQVATKYKCEHTLMKTIPEDWEKCVAEYHTFIGSWNMPDCKKWENLPVRARYYIEYIEKYLGVPIKFVRIGGENPRVIRKPLSE